MTKEAKYRPEIDGLRAVAVLTVLFYHKLLYSFNVKAFSLRAAG